MNVSLIHSLVNWLIFLVHFFLLWNINSSQTQEAERIGKIKCKYNGDAIRFTLKKTTTFKELIRMVEGQWGKGKGVKFKDEDQDWVIMNTNDEVVEVWEQTKTGIVTLEVFSTQQNQVFFVVYSLLVLFVSVCVHMYWFFLTFIFS